MNSCEYYQELISRLVDGEVNRDEYAALMAHMKDCSRCNAMYAVFHDLSEILGEETEPLPEGLHENIMAGVRRSAIEKQNRRRRGGIYKTILTAAACAALVLFAAKGLNPAERAGEVTMSAQEVEQLAPAQNGAAVVEQAPAAAAEEEALPASPVPTAVAKNEPATPASTETPVTESAAAQPTAAAKPVRTAEPTVKPTEKPVETAAAEEPTAPVVIEESVQPTADVTETVEERASTDTGAVEAEADSESAEMTEGAVTPAEDKAAAAPTAESAVTAAPALNEAPAESEQPKPSLKNLAPRFRLAAPSLAADTASDEPEASDEKSAEAEETEAPDAKKTGVHVYGDENYKKLMALLDGEEKDLPEGEADKQVTIHYMPSDPYRDEQTVTVYIYGEDVYYKLSDGEKTFAAACSVSELEQFAALMRAEETAQPSATPTAEESPAAAER